MTARTINWTLDKLEKLRAAYDTAVKQRVTAFKVEIDKIDTEFNTGYAKYLIEYLDGEFAKVQPRREPAREGEESYTPGSGSWEGGAQ